jgi:hypothetical protein
MFKHLLAGLLILLPLTFIQAQTVTGRVVSQTSGAPLPHTTVRLDGQPVGTTTDEAGCFHLPLASTAPNAQLLISHLGYQSQVLPLSQLGPTVALEELSYQIGEVLVTYESIRKLLLRTWKIDEGSVVAVADNVIADLQQTDSVKAKKLLQNPSSLRSALKMARLVFLDDGRVKTKFWLFGASAKWQLDERQRTLRVVGSKGNDATMTVVELTTDRLIVHDAKLNRQSEVYIPAE